MTHSTERLDKLDSLMRTRIRHRLVIVTIMAFVVFALLVYIAITVARLDRYATEQKSRADAATQSTIANCDQVRELGYVCRSDPAALPQVGAAGRAPTEAEIREAVETYFMRHPSEPGRPPTPEEIAAAVTNYLTEHPPTAGPGPTNEQIANAVQTYLTRHPPSAEFACPPGRGQTQMTVLSKNNGWQTITTCT